MIFQKVTRKETYSEVIILVLTTSYLPKRGSKIKSLVSVVSGEGLKNSRCSNQSDQLKRYSFHMAKKKQGSMVTASQNRLAMKSQCIRRDVVLKE